MPFVPVPDVVLLDHQAEERKVVCKSDFISRDCNLKGSEVSFPRHVNSRSTRWRFRFKVDWEHCFVTSEPALRLRELRI